MLDVFLRWENKLICICDVVNFRGYCIGCVGLGILIYFYGFFFVYGWW